MRQKLIADLLQLESITMAYDKVTRYMLALGFLGLGLGVQRALDPWLGNALSRPSVFTAVLLAAWYCGVGPAILIAALGYPAVEYLLLDQPLSVWGPHELIPSLGVYIAVCTIVIFSVTRFRWKDDQLKVAEDKLKAIEGKLRESEQRIRANFDNAVLGMVEVDQNGRFIEVNERLCRIVGYNREELLGMGVNDITAPEDRLRTNDFSADLLEGCERRLDIDIEKRYVRRDGSLLWVHVTASPVRDDAGRFLYSIGTIEDIDERKHTQETVALLSHAIESAANSIVLTDRKGQILWVNQAFTRLTGYSPEEVVAKNPRILKSGHQPPGFYQELWDTISRGDNWCGQLVNRRKDGTLYDEEMTITPVRAQGGDITHFVSVKEDVTERKRAEESLRAAMMSAEQAKAGAEQAKAGAEQANHAKDRFIAVLSHELRTPLTPVLAAAQLMQRKFDDMRRPLEMICRNVQLEARLIDDLLDLTRIAQGKLALERKAMDVRAVVESAVEICRPDIGVRKLHFAVEMGDSPHRVNGDASRLQQVIWNLLTNAVKFPPDGGRVGVSCGRENGRVVIEIADTGIGIEPAEAARIFDAFEQGGRDTARQFGGLGLGLAIAKRLVEMHEGDVSVHSEGKGCGSAFRVSLPLLAAEPETQEGKPAAVAGGPSKRILLVEDNGDTATTMAMLLEAFGHKVHTAGDVAQALKAIAANSFDLLISDLGLPDRSGIELMQELRGRGNALKGIALSGYGQGEDVERSKGAGFSVHLTKPVDAERLEETIARLL